MEAAMKINSHEEITSFEEGKSAASKETSASKKLNARRAIEDHLARKLIEKKLEEYYFS